MIINRQGAKFEYEGVTHTIGGAIVGTAESEYEGLYGRINAIHDGDDKETENETPDIYCEFDPPVLPCEIKALEKTFSDLYDEPKTLDDIILDMVIMAPEMVRPLEDLYSARHQLPVIAVVEDWAVDGESGHSEELFADLYDAKRIFHDKLSEEMDSGSMPNWEGKTGFTVDSTPCSYECWLDGEYGENHYALSIKTSNMLIHREEHQNAFFATKWTDGSVVITPCKVNLRTKQVYDIIRSPWDCDGTLENELLLLDGEEYDVAFGKASAQDGLFWYD